MGKTVRYSPSTSSIIEMENETGHSAIDLLSIKSKRNFNPNTHSANTFTPKYRKMSSCRRMNLIGICSISGLCCLLLLTTNNNQSQQQHGQIVHPNSLSVSQSFGGNQHLAKNNLKNSATSGNGAWSNNLRQLTTNTNSTTAINQNLSYSSNNSTNSLKEILEAQRLRIANELKTFDYNNDIMDNNSIGNNFINNRTLFGYIQNNNQSNYQPIRSLIVTSWRSGSTFLGDILNAMPANYYHYEPLLHYGIQQIRTTIDEEKALIILKNLLNCDYQNDIMGDYLNYGMSHTYLFEHNERLWSVCKEHPVLCWQSQFLTPFCKLFPLQSMKTVRLRTRSVETLLSDSSLNVRIVLLVRDPRGTIQSRRHRTWCAGNPDCDNPSYLCDDLVDDYVVSSKLLEKYPNRFRPIRYEDLSLNPYEMTQSILQFYGLPFDSKVEEFLDTHTKVNMGGVSSTYRDSKSAPFHWKSDLKPDEIKHIQKECVEAMELWGYRRIENYNNYTRHFDPIIFPAPFT